MPARKGGDYSQERVQFWQSDPRITFTVEGKPISATQAHWLFGAGQIALQERSDVLPQHFTPESVGVTYRIDRATSRKAFRIFAAHKLVGETKDGRLIVVGVGKRHSNLNDWGERIDDLSTYERSHKIREEKKGEDKKRKEKKTAPPSAATTEVLLQGSRFQRIYKILRSINAQGYEIIRPTEGWERDLAAETGRLGFDRVVSEAEDFKRWLETRFEEGTEDPYKKRHKPRPRFITNWLKRCAPGDQRDQSRSRGRERPTDRIRREAELADGQCPNPI